MDNNNNQNNQTSDRNSPVMGQRVTEQVQRFSQIELITNNLDAGLYPAMVTGLAAVLAQMQSQEQGPMLTVSFTASIPGYQRSMSLTNGVLSGHDLTHHFYDVRSSLSYGPLTVEWNRGKLTVTQSPTTFSHTTTVHGANTTPA